MKRLRASAGRVLRLLAALLQLVLPGAAAWADARLDAAGTRAAAHIESHSTATCVRVHPADCALCRFLGTPPVAGRRSVLVLDSPSDTRRHCAAAAHEPRAVARAHPQSRAPPPLS